MKISSSVHIMGMVAGALTTSSAIPEVLKIHRTGKTGGIPLLMALAMVVGELLWVTYASLLGLPSLGIFSTVTVVLWLYITYHVVKETYTA